MKYSDQKIEKFLKNLDMKINPSILRKCVHFFSHVISSFPSSLPTAPLWYSPGGEGQIKVEENSLGRRSPEVEISEDDFDPLLGSRNEREDALARVTTRIDEVRSHERPVLWTVGTTQECLVTLCNKKRSISFLWINKSKPNS